MTKKILGPTAEEIEAAEAQIVQQTKRIDFYITEYSVEILAQKLRDGEYVIPSYQREFTWEDARKSKFIESLIMGLPIPFVFFWVMPSGKLEIVDGSQRLRTIKEFLYDGYRIGELESLTALVGFSFDDLDSSRQRKILNRSVRGIVLDEETDEAARLDMFERINTGSKNANMAEIRRGALAGPFTDLVMTLAVELESTGLAPVSEKQKKERGYEELVTRFFAYGDGLEAYRDRPADFLFDYTKAMNNRFAEDPSLAVRCREEFDQVMRFIAGAFPFGFRKSPSGRATPRTRFEAIAIGARLAIMDRPDLLEANPNSLGVAEWIEGAEFGAITRSDGANAIAKLRGRINYVRDKLVRSDG